MAITVSTNYYQGSVTLPTGYINPTNPSLPAGEQSSSGFVTDILASLVDNSDPIIGAGNLVAQVTAYFNATFAPDVLGLDAAKIIDVNISITKAVREKDSPIFQTGTDKYIVQTDIKYVTTP